MAERGLTMAKVKEEQVEEEGYKHEVLNKSNIFIGTKYKSSLLCNKVTYLAMLKAQCHQYEKKPDGIYVELSASVIKESAHITGHSVYERLKEVADEMTGNNIGMVDDELQKFIYITLINKASYDDGLFSVRFPLEFESELLNVESSFTQLPKRIAMSFKNACSFPLYQLLKSNCYYPKTYHGPRNNKFIMDIGLAELKLQIGVVDANDSNVKKVLNNSRGTEKDYEKAVAVAESGNLAMHKAWGDFNRRCLKPCIEEINNISDIYVKAVPKGEGKGGKIKRIEFTVWLEGAEKTQADTNPVILTKDGRIESSLSISEQFMIQAEACNILDDPSLQLKDIQNICEAANYDLSLLSKAKSLLDKQKNVNNTVGWLISCIKEGYEQPTGHTKKQKNQFNEFEQNDYDFDQIERDFLSN